jgi:hypothetical protein
MDIYKRRTQIAINRFLGHRIGFTDCIAALQDALAVLIPDLPPDELPALRALLLANNEIVMTEMERREAGRQPTPGPTRPSRIDQK